MSTHRFLVLDMTGSRSSKKEATIDACNEYRGGQQSNGLGDDTVFTLGVFNSNIGMERIVDGVPIDQAPRIEHEHYRPDGATPLYDAVGQAMDLLEAYEGQVENKVRHLTTLLEPLMIVVLGVIVACIVFAVLLPMLSMNEALTGGS